MGGKEIMGFGRKREEKKNNIFIEFESIWVKKSKRREKAMKGYNKDSLEEMVKRK